VLFLANAGKSLEIKGVRGGGTQRYNNRGVRRT
jgi:hypothetical protein